MTPKPVVTREHRDTASSVVRYAQTLKSFHPAEYQHWLLTGELVRVEEAWLELASVARALAEAAARERARCVDIASREAGCRAEGETQDALFGLVAMLASEKTDAIMAARFDVPTSVQAVFQVTEAEGRRALAHHIANWNGALDSLNAVLAKRSPEPAQAVNESGTSVVGLDRLNELLGYEQQHGYYEKACAHYSATVDQLEAANKRLRELTDASGFAEARMEAAELERDRAKAEAQRAEQRLSETEDQLDAAVKERSASARYLATAQERIRELEAQLDTANKRLQAFEASDIMTGEELGTLRRRVAELALRTAGLLCDVGA